MLTECAEGTSALAVIRGSTATGKTELLRALCKLAADRGFRVLTAIGSALEKPFPYALLEQLFPEASPQPPAEENDRPDDHPSGTPEGAHTATVPPRTLRHIQRAAHQLAAERPLLLAIDDVQHADHASLHCLLYLIRRLRSAPIALVVTASPHSASDHPLLSEMRYQPVTRHYQLSTLSLPGIATLLARQMDEEHAERVAEEFLSTSGGNPLLVRALLHDTTGAAPGAERPSMVAGDAFHQAALACVHRSGDAARQMARGIALLAGHGSTELAGRLVEVTPRAAAQALEVLTESGLLRQEQFRHPALRAAVLDDIPAARLTELHRRAARMLREEGAPPTAIAEHLLHCGPLGEGWEAPLLRLAAEQFLFGDQHKLAGHCLRLASRCWTKEEDRLADQAAAASITWRIDPKAVIPQLQSLTSPAAAGMLSPHTVLHLTRALLWCGLESEAVAAAGGLPHDGHGPELTDELLVTWLRLATTYPGALTRMRGALGPTPPRRVPPASETDSPGLNAARSLHTALTGGDAKDIVAGAELVLQSVQLGKESMELPQSALHALIYIDRLNLAESWCDRLLDQAAKQFTPAWDALLISTKAMISLRKGKLPAARDQALEALSLMPVLGWSVGIALPLATLVEAYTAMGEHEAAAEVLLRPVPEAAFQTRFGVHYQYARARHHLAIDQCQAALSCFLSIGRQLQTWRIDCPGLAPWRVGAAEAWLLLNKPQRAAELLDEQLRRAERHQPRAAGAALRALAATRAPAQRPALLVRALEMFQTGGDRYNMTRALADLSKAQQQLGNGSEARQVVRRALRLAQECGAEHLQQSILPTLTSEAPPARPRAKALESAALTDAERRVASLAAQGHTNREVAAKLYITVSTVEQHLTRVYRKFQIKHRHQLPASLGFVDAATVA